MPTLIFEGISAFRDAEIPAEVLAVTGERMLADGKEVARHGNGFWEHRGVYHTAGRVDGPCRLTFEQAGKRRLPTIGPCPVRLADGAVIAGGRYVARLDERTGLWQRQTDNSECETMLITDA